VTRISFVIPCYCSEKTIPIVIEEIHSIMRGNTGYDYEIILVNDFSPDSVYKVISDLAQIDMRIKGIDLAKNFGQHSALMAGYGAAQGDIVVSLDDDGQIPLENVFELIKKIEDGYDVVYASFENNVRGGFRTFGTRMNDIMANILLQKPKELHITSFFAMKKFVCEEIIRYQSPYPYVSGLVLRTTKNVCNISMKQRARLMGASGYNFHKLLSLWLNGFTAFSIKPLRIATIAGAFCAFMGFLFGVWVIIRKLCHPEILAGYSSMVALLLFIGGVIMLMLGLIGEYIGRIYICINQSPQYVVRQTINIDQDE